MFLDLLFTFFFASASLFLMRKVARKVGLVDKPCDRKVHKGEVPLVGGVAICITLVHYLYLSPNLIEDNVLFMVCISTLTVIGVLDDKFDLSVKFRMLVQIIISCAMIYFSGAQITSLGNIFGTGNIELNTIGPIITIFAVIGSINAFNMVDGIDGLLGGLSIVTFSSLGLLFYAAGESNLAYLCVLMVVIITPYIILNLGLIGHRRKVFMGDAGSMLIGFTVIWFLVSSSQKEQLQLIQPVTALWLIAIPLMDMAAIMIRRIKQGNSPFKPDREHLHHICQSFGLSSRQTLMFICSVAIVLAGFGIVGEIMNIPEYVMFLLFIILFVFYLVALMNYENILQKISNKTES